MQEERLEPTAKRQRALAADEDQFDVGAAEEDELFAVHDFDEDEHAALQVEAVLESACEDEEQQQQQQRSSPLLHCAVCGCVRLLADAGLSRQPATWKWSCWPCYSAWYDEHVVLAPHS